MSSIQSQPALRRFMQVAPSLIGALLLYWLFRSLNFDELRAALGRMPLWIIPLIMLAAALGTALQGLRFWVLFPAGLGRLQHVLLAFALSAGNILLPLRGGEIIRPIYMRRWVPRASMGAIVTWTLIDKVMEAVCLAPFVVLLGALFWADPRFATLRRWLVPVLGVALGVAAALALLRLRGLFGRPLLVFGRALTLHALALGIVLSLLIWAVNYAIFFAVVPDFKLALVLLVAVCLSVALPSLPAGLGPYEAAFLWIGQLSGREQESLMAAALISHLAQIFSTLLFGLPVLLVWGWPQRLPEEGERDPATDGPR